MHRNRFATLALVGLAAAPTGRAQTAPAQASDEPPLATITVIGTTPLPGTHIDIDKIPGNTQSITAGDLTRSGSASMMKALDSQLGSISIDDNLGDSFQPDILFRGFEASPVLGTPEGLAVYQNGVRINEAFGDSVNWDLFPDVAIDRLDIVSSNPLYGLNALGGAVIVNMKNGFTYRGGELELSGGSFGRRAASIQYGANNGTVGAYVAARVLDEDGWRDFSPNALRQLYTDFSSRTEALTLDLSFTGANNRLFGESPTPVQELAVGRSKVFTVPQYNFNQLEFVTLNGSYAATDALSLQGTAYYREFRQAVINGNTTTYTACTDSENAGFLCQDDGMTVLLTNKGTPMPNISAGGTIPIGQNDSEAIRSVVLGGSLQATSTASILDHDNHLSVGATIDHAATDFQSAAELGTVNPLLRVTSSGLFVSTPENTPFSATPVNLGASNDYYSAFLTDTLDITPALALTVSGRYNVALVDLNDRQGTALNGQNRYSRFNSAAGLTYKLLPTVTAYAGYAEGNRVPTPGEIECSNPESPCLLPSSLSSDPPNLRQVVSRNYEIGLRGRFDLGQGHATWNVGLFRNDLSDDIFGVATSSSAGFFQNIGGTRRQGVEAGLRYRSDKLDVFASCSYIDATFQSALLLNSPSHPFQDANGNIHVRPGDQLPGVPQNRLKVGADYHILEGWMIGADLTYVGEQFYHGDESNQLSPLPAYAVVDLHSTYEVADSVELFASIDNVFDSHHATFGVLGDPTGIGAPGIPLGAATNSPGVDNRFQSPAPPIAAYGGVRMKF